MSNLIDTLQTWLQGEMNACVAGHTARIERLEESVRDQTRLIESLHRELDSIRGTAENARDNVRATLDDAEEKFIKESIEQALDDYDFTAIVKDAIADLEFDVRVI